MPLFHKVNGMISLGIKWKLQVCIWYCENNDFVKYTAKRLKVTCNKRQSLSKLEQKKPFHLCYELKLQERSKFSHCQRTLCFFSGGGWTTGVTGVGVTVSWTGKSSGVGLATPTNGLISNFPSSYTVKKCWQLTQL